MATVWHPIWEPVWDTITGSNMVAVLDTNLVAKMGNFLPPSVNAAFLGTKMVPSMRHCCLGGFLVSKTGTKNAATLALPVFALPIGTVIGKYIRVQVSFLAIYSIQLYCCAK